MSLAREVGTGQVAVYQQYEIERNEQSAQAGRMHTIIADAGAKVEYLENMLKGYAFSDFGVYGAPIWIYYMCLCI